MIDVEHRTLGAFEQNVVAAHVHGESGLDGPDLPAPSASAKPEHAVEYLASVYRGSEKPVLVATGPLTNVGLFFATHADANLSESELAPETVVDALVHGSDLTLDLCAELARLAPFGLGNPGVTLLVAGCELRDVAAVGDGKHLRFRVKDGARDAGSAIAFGFGGREIGARPGARVRDLRREERLVPDGARLLGHGRVARHRGRHRRRRVSRGTRRGVRDVR